MNGAETRSSQLNESKLGYLTFIGAVIGSVYRAGEFDRYSLTTALICVVAYFLMSALAHFSVGIYRLYYELRQERNWFIRVEWLYRAVRTMVTNSSAIEKMEKEIISGTDEQRESW
ncbi:hypothetical protein [uncultured Muribaculum sp.]|uniref:hypothetical protein n=1 Tax=uncultured Muribaculum sp. TaxID=1918613 RepID=UPI0026708A17|nr:hypothetical protein [uncultured Muribaculum sp.]